MSAPDSVWVRGRFEPAEGVCDRVRAVIEAQERRAHPGLRLPARDDHAVRIKPLARLRESTLAVIVYAAQQRHRSPQTRWYWRIADDELQPRGYAYLAAESDETKLQRAERSLAHWQALVRAALEMFGQLDTPFVGLASCAICGRALVEPTSLAMGIGPECIQLFADRSADSVAHFLGTHAKAAASAQLPLDGVAP